MRRVVCSIGLLWFTRVWADTAAADFALRMQQIKTMQAQYTQVVRAHSREVSRASGDMALAKPKQFRWVTREPLAQQIVADGQRIWVYDVDLEQVTVEKQSKLLHTGVALLLDANIADIQQSFDITRVQDANAVVFILQAKSARADLQRLQFQFKANQLIGFELFDSLGQQTRVRFQRIRINQAVSPRQFQFIPPPGVEVLDAGETHV